MILQPNEWNIPTVTILTDNAQSPSRFIGIKFAEAWSERAVVVEGETKAEFNNCVFSNNLVGIDAAEKSVVIIDNSKFTGNYEACAQARGTATLEIRNSSLYGAEQSHMIKTPFGQRVTVIIENCSFYGLLYQGDDRGIGVYIGPLGNVVIRNSYFEELDSAIETHQAESVLIENNRIDKCNGGIWIWNLPDSRTDAQILKNVITHCSSGICLAGHTASLLITENRIMYCGQGINVQIPACGGSEAPFDGVIQGTGNVLRSITTKLCPPINSPFWPEGFFK